MKQNFRVLIAACDTFRAGAVEQLRTHEKRLNAIYPPESDRHGKRCHVYEKGYGKDAAHIAQQAIYSGLFRDCFELLVICSMIVNIFWYIFYASSYLLYF